MLKSVRLQEYLGTVLESTAQAAMAFAQPLLLARQDADLACFSCSVAQ